VEAGGAIAVLHTADKKLLDDARAYLDAAITISPDKPEAQPLIFDVIE
jgi:thymidine phosphorylase